MDSEDDYQSFSPLPEPSPQVQQRRLKRLRKKAIQVPDPLPNPADDLFSFPRVDFSDIEALEASEIKTLDSQFDDSNESGNPLPDSVDDLLPVPRVDFAKLEAEEASETRNLDSGLGGSEEPGNLEPDSVEDLLPIPRVDFEKLEALEASITKSLDCRSDDPNEQLLSQNSQNSSGHENEMEGEKREEGKTTSQIGDGLALGEDRPGTKRALDFDGFDERKGKLELEISGKKQKTEGSCNVKEGEEENKKKKKNKRIKRDDSASLKSNKPVPNKRIQEKERKAYLQQLHAESQRLLRETVDASFKPMPVMNKPISSVLEKIRKRKLEVSKKIVMQHSNTFTSGSNGDLEYAVLGSESENASAEEKEDKTKMVKQAKEDGNKVHGQSANSDKLVKEVEEDGNQVHRESANSLGLDNAKESASPSSCGNSPTTMKCDEKSTTMFPPIEDAQDLSGDTKTRVKEADLLLDDLDSPLEEVFAPSLLATSVPSNDSSSEEENDKENVDPVSYCYEDDCPSPRGDPVKAFVDEEAEEEDDSDNDLLLFKETEEDENLEDSEELNDIVVTEYEEKPNDSDLRNELHQKWLQQQDATGTETLLQRLNVSAEFGEASPRAEKNYYCEDEEHNDADEEEELEYPTQINLKKAKQIISQMFLDKEEVFLSDEDKETEKKILKNRLVRSEELAPLVSPVEDESSREVFGLIKKLNIAPQNRKKAKPSSYFDSVLKGGDGKCSLKSSFLGRSSNHHLPSTHKKVSTSVRSFIFGRDDSNSRGSVSTSDEFTDTISKEKQPTKTITAKYTSQTKFSRIEHRKASAEAASGTSLFEILKRSSEQPSICNGDDPLDLTHVISSFKIPKKPTKIEARS